MDQNQNNEYLPPEEEPKPAEGGGSLRTPRKYSLGTLLSLLCFVAVASVMLTYTLTSLSVRDKYVGELQKQQVQLELLKASLNGVTAGDGGDFGKLEFLAELFEVSSYYADDVSREDRLNAVLKSYAASVGDAYSEYYTEEEYAEFSNRDNGKYVGIGVSVVQTSIVVDGVSYAAFQIVAIFKNAPAASSGLRCGDYIYGIKVDDAYVGLAYFGGYTAALDALRGEEGTQAEFLVLRQSEDLYETLEFSVARATYVADSVSYTTLEKDPTVGIVQISSFDLSTPTQFKEAINALLSEGVEHFIFDVRNNPGGNVQSVKAVLTYFLKKGDLILATVNREGERVRAYLAEAMQSTDEYAACNVAESEIGMYADLDMVVLCNSHTASAAEVFTATMRDYGLAPIVGETTYGKGVLQTLFPLSELSMGVYDGYVKLTTNAYVTKCGVTYHGVGVSPDGDEISLSEEAMEYSFYLLPQSLDDQLQAAAEAFGK